HSQKPAQPQGIRRPPCDPALAIDAFEIPDQEQAEVLPRRQARPPHLLRVELRALLLDKLVKAAPLQHSVELFIEKDARPSEVTPCAQSTAVLGVAASLFGPSHAHILRTSAVGHNTFSQESRLAPRPA